MVCFHCSEFCLTHIHVVWGKILLFSEKLEVTLCDGIARQFGGGKKQLSNAETMGKNILTF